MCCIVPNNVYLCVIKVNKQLKNIKIMKKQSTTLLATISKAQVENLTNIVKETIVPGYSQRPTRQFTAADLWNIQSQRRSFVQRRFAL